MSIKSAINLGTGIATTSDDQKTVTNPPSFSRQSVSFLSLGQECTPLFATATCLAINCFPRYISAPVSQSFLSAATRFVIEFSFLIPSPVYHCVFVTIYSCSQLFVPTYFQCRFLVQYIILLLWDFNGENGKKCEALRGYLGISMSLPPPRVWLLG